MRKKILSVFIVVVFSLICSAIALHAQKSSDTARTKIGNPPQVSEGWPTTGKVTQGPQGPGGHKLKGLVAIDIANTEGTPIHATFDGVAYTYNCSSSAECNYGYGRLGNFVKLVPDIEPNAIILFAHLMEITVSNGSRVRIGDQLGLMGYTGYVEPSGPGGTHLHYEFRGIPMAPPYIPEEITPPTCGEGKETVPCSPSEVP